MNSRVLLIRAATNLDRLNRRLSNEIRADLIDGRWVKRWDWRVRDDELPWTDA